MQKHVQFNNNQRTADQKLWQRGEPRHPYWGRRKGNQMAAPLHTTPNDHTQSRSNVCGQTRRHEAWGGLLCVSMQSQGVWTNPLVRVHA